MVIFLVIIFLQNLFTDLVFANFNPRKDQSLTYGASAIINSNSKNILQDNLSSFKLAKCENGINFCPNSENNIECCVGESNLNYQYSIWSQYLGTKNGEKNFQFCALYPRSDESIKPKCEWINDKNLERDISIDQNLTGKLKLTLTRFDYKNPGFDAEFDYINARKNYKVNGSDKTCYCSEDGKKNSLHCAGYVFTKDAIEEKSFPNSKDKGCEKVFNYFSANCPSYKMCDGSKFGYPFIPSDLKNLDSNMISCYTCNQAAHIAKMNCLFAKNCLHDDFINSNSNEISSIAEGEYGCIFFKNNRAGCSISLNNTSRLRHFPRIARSDYDEKRGLKLNPTYNLFLEMPYIRQFQDDDKSNNAKNGCTKLLKAELGSEFRGTFFRPKAHVVFGLNDIEMQFGKNLNPNNHSRIYDYSALQNMAPDEIKNIIKASKFNNEIYRIYKAEEIFNGKECIKKYLDDYADILIRLEYNKRTGEDELVGYVIYENYSENNIDYISGEIKSQAINSLNTNYFIDDDIKIIDIKNNITLENIYNNKAVTIYRINSVERPPLRHFYYPNQAVKIQYPIEIKPNYSINTIENINNYEIKITPFFSVPKEERRNVLDSTLPSKIGQVKINKSILANRNESSERCTFIYGHEFCIDNDPCSSLLFIENQSYLQNPPEISSCSRINNTQDKKECITASMYVPYCNSKIFCNDISNCNNQDLLNLKIIYDNIKYYKFNKEFRLNPKVCITNYWESSAIKNDSNVKRFGPYGFIPFDYVVAFSRDIKDNSQLSTRPITNQSPNKKPIFEYSDIYNPSEYDVLSLNPLKNISEKLERNEDILSYIPATRTDLKDKILLRNRLPDELPDDILCSSINYTVSNTWQFDKSRQQKYDDYELYVPLRCQYLDSKLIGAGGAGMIDDYNNWCKAQAVIQRYMPKVASSGCGGGYARGILDLHQIQNGIEFLSLQIGEITKTERNYNDINNNADCAKAYIPIYDYGKFSGGFHPTNNPSGNEAGKTVLSFKKNDGSYEEIIGATRGESQLTLLKQNAHNYLSYKGYADAGCLAAITGMIIFFWTPLGAIVSTLFGGPALATAALGGLMPYLCFTYKPDYHLSEQCAGIGYINERYSNAIFDKILEKGEKAKMSTGQEEPIYKISGTNILCSKFDENKLTKIIATEEFTNQLPENITSSELKECLTQVSQMCENNINNDEGCGNEICKITNISIKSYSNHILEINKYYKILPEVKKQLIKKEEIEKYNPSPTECPDGLKKIDNYCAKCQSCEEYERIVVNVINNNESCQNAEIKEISNQGMEYSDCVIYACKSNSTDSRNCKNWQTYDPTGACIETKITDDSGSLDFMKLISFNDQEKEGLLRSTLQFANHGSANGINISSYPRFDILHQKYTISQSQLTNIDNSYLGSGGAFNDGWKPEFENKIDNSRYANASSSGAISIAGPQIAVKIFNNQYIPIFENGKKSLNGTTKMTDPQCKTRCPRINVKFKDISIPLTNEAGRKEYVTLDLICEYSGDTNIDQEINNSSNIEYPTKCVIDNFSQRFKDRFERYKYSILYKSTYCPIANCLNGMYNTDDRYYGLCKHKDNINFITASDNIFSGTAFEGTEVKTISYDNNMNKINYEEYSLTKECVSSINSSLISHDMFDNIATLANIKNLTKLGLYCENGFWIHLDTKKNYIDPKTKSFIYKAIDIAKDGNHNCETSNGSSIHCLNSNGTLQSGINTSGREIDFLFTEIEKSYKEISYNKRSVFKDQIYCPALSNNIPFDFEYTQGILWNSTKENEEAIAICNNGRTIRRKCKVNGIWGKINGSC